MSSLLRLSLTVMVVLNMTEIASTQQGQSTLVVSNPNTAHLDKVRDDELSDDIERILWWLPEDTEAVLVSRGNVPVPEQLAAPASDSPSLPALRLNGGYRYPTHRYSYQDLVAGNCIEPLVYNRALCSGETRDKLINTIYGRKTAKLFVKAVSWRKNSSETCDIVLFGDNTANRIMDLFGVLPSVAQQIGKVPVLEVDLDDPRSVEPEAVRAALKDQRSDRRWLAAPRPNVYIATTSGDLLKKIIERIGRRGEKRALPSDLAEWHQLDLAAPAWGLRHYRASTASRDSLSMLERDHNAKGLVFFGSDAKSSTLTLRYLSGSKDGAARFLRMQSDWLRTYPVRQEDANSLAPFIRIDTNCFESRTRINVPPSDVGGKPFTNLSVDATFFFCMDSMYMPWLGFLPPQKKWTISSR